MRSVFTAAVLTCLMLGAVTLAACAPVRKPDIRLPIAFEAPPESLAPAGAVALDRWWLAYDDPQLTTLIEQTLAANPDARSAAARLREARASKVSGLLAFLPQGSATASEKRTHTEQLSGAVANIPGFSTAGTSDNTTANFNVSWEVDVFGRVLAARKAVNGDLAAARFDYEGTRASLAAQVADAYFQARGLAIQRDDALETARIQRSLYDVAAQRGALGLAATSEADRIAGDLAQAEAQAAGLEAQLQVQRRTLLILAGRIVEPTSNIAVAPHLGEIPPIPAEVPSTLLARRPDVRQALARVASASGRADAAALAFFPTFTLTPGLGWSKIAQPGFSSTSQTWTLGGMVSQPILSIPRLLADLKASNARTEQAVIAYEKSVQTAFAESESALVQLDADRRRVVLLVQGEARAARAYKAARTGYDLGLNDLQTTLGAEQTWRGARTQLTSAEVQALRRSVQAYKALGGGWPADRFLTQAQAR